MKVTVMGTGGVGGYFGARLANAGCAVGFVARGAHLAAIREQGLRVESTAGNLHLRNVRVSDKPEEFGVPDLVLFGVKLWDTEGAAQAIRPIVGEHTCVLSLQNGVVKDEILRTILPASSLIGGVCYIATTIAEPGLIRHTGNMQKLAFGEFDGSVSERVKRFGAACATAGLDYEISANIQRTIWEKFVFLVGLSGTTASMRVPIGRIRADEHARAFLADVIAEVVAVARAEGVELAADFVANRMAFADQLPATMTASMHHDLERGGRIELPWLSGDVAARGQRLGVPTPCNRAITAILSVHRDGRPQ